MAGLDPACLYSGVTLRMNRWMAPRKKSKDDSIIPANDGWFEAEEEAAQSSLDVRGPLVDLLNEGGTKRIRDWTARHFGRRHSLTLRVRLP